MQTKDQKFLEMRFEISRKNITHSCDVCAFPYRSTNGPIRFDSRVAEPSQWAHFACTAAARCVRVLSALSAQNLNYLHHPSVQDQYASNIRAAALRSLRSKRHSACYCVLLFEGTPSVLLDRFGLTAPYLRTQLWWVEHNIYWINNSDLGGFSDRGTNKVRAHSRWWDPVTWKGSLGVLCVDTRYGGIHLPTFVILFRLYIIRNIMSPKHVAIV
jgi:hypothetical protein